MALSERSALYRRALELIPGGVNSPVRAMRAVGLDEPLFVKSGEGAYVETEDRRRLLDWVMSWGPLLFGHADPETVEAVREAALRGTSFGAATEAEIELAAEIVDAVPSVEKVRLVSSGTEAGMSALRLARAFTKRDRILKTAGGYHGHADALLASGGSGLATLGIPASPGVPAISFWVLIALSGRFAGLNRPRSWLKPMMRLQMDDENFRPRPKLWNVSRSLLARFPARN